MTAVLFARKNSVYRKLPVDVFDEKRDARTYDGQDAVIAHPPCRGWGRYHHWAKVRPGELDLARFAVLIVRTNGGVLEHPEYSKLWRDQALPRPGEPPDSFGGYTIKIDQVDFGHRAQKPTWLYIVGCPVERLPQKPSPGTPTNTIENMGRPERERTPFELATWLVRVAERVE